MPKMQVKGTKEYVDIPADKVQAAYLSGKYGFPSDQPIPVISPDGTFGHIPVASASKAFQTGFKAASPEDIRKAELQEKYGGAGGVAKAGVAGAARGLTLGLSDVYGSALGQREALSGLREANPVASIGGEVVGAVAPMIATGGTAAPLEAASGARLAAGGTEAVLEGARAAEAINAARGLARAEAAAGEGAQAARMLGRGKVVEPGVASGFGLSPEALPAASARVTEAPGVVRGLPRGAAPLAREGRVSEGLAGRVAEGGAPPAQPGIVRAGETSPTINRPIEGEFVEDAFAGALPGPGLEQEYLSLPTGAMQRAPGAGLGTTPGVIEGEFADQAVRGALPGAATDAEYSTIAGQLGGAPGVEAMGGGVAGQIGPTGAMVTEASMRHGVPLPSVDVMAKVIREAKAAKIEEVIGTSATQAEAEMLSHVATLSPTELQGVFYQSGFVPKPGMGLKDVLREAVRILGAPNRAVLEAGNLAEAGAKAILGTGAKSFGGRLAQRAVSSAIRTGVEGALYGAAQEMDESILGDHELTGEKLIAAMGHGALLGAGLGAAGASISEIAGSALGRVSPMLEGLAGAQAWKSLNATKGFTKRANKMVKGGAAEVGNTMLRHDVIPRGEGVVAAALHPEEIAERLESAVQKAGEQIGEYAKRAQGSSIGIDVEKLVAELDKKIYPYRGKALHEGIVASLENAKTSLSDHLVAGGFKTPDGRVLASFEDLVKQRRAVQAMAFKENPAIDPKMRVQLLRDFASVLDGVEQQFLDHAGLSGKEWKTLKLDFHKLRIAQDAAIDSSAGMFRNRAFSLGDRLSGITGAVAGGSLGHIGSAVGGLASAMAAKVIRERGNPIAAYALDKAAQFRVVQQATQRMDREVDQALTAFFHTAQGRAVAHAVSSGRESKVDDSKPINLEKEYSDRVTLIANMKARDNLKAEQLAKLFGGANHIPNTLKAAMATSAAATNYLASKIPPGNLDPYSLTPRAQRKRVSDAEMTRFMRFARAVDNPLTLVHDLNSGRVSKDAVDAVSHVYPKMYAQIVKGTNERLAVMKTAPSYSARVQLGTLLNRPTDRTMTRQAVQMSQQTFQNKQPKAPKMGGGRGGLKGYSSTVSLGGSHGF